MWISLVKPYQVRYQKWQKVVYGSLLQQKMELKLTVNLTYHFLNVYKIQRKSHFEKMVNVKNYKGFKNNSFARGFACLTQIWTVIQESLKSSLRDLFENRLEKDEVVQQLLQKCSEKNGVLQDKGLNMEDDILVDGLLESLNEVYDALVTDIIRKKAENLEIIRNILLNECRKKGENDSKAISQAGGKSWSVKKSKRSKRRKKGGSGTASKY